MTRGSRRGTRGGQTQAPPAAAETPASETQTSTNANITIRVGQMGGEPRTVKGAAGMTVEQVLRNADISVDKRQPMIKGSPVDGSYVVEDGDLIIVTTKVKGGTR